MRVLLDVEGRGPTLADRLARKDVAALDTRERAFLHELVLGTLRHRGALDHAIEKLSGRRIAELQPASLVAILRLAAYQLLNLRVPDRAAVSEAVELAKDGAPRAGGLVNAVLRRLAREGAPPTPDAATDPLGWLTTTGSLPTWLAERWIAELGPAGAIARADVFLQPAPTHLRLNPRRPEAQERLAAAGVALEPLDVPGAFRARAAVPAELLADGSVYAQDAGSQRVAHLAAGGRRTLDACAAPGSKTTLLADLAPDGTVIAMEFVAKRRRTLRELVARWGSPNVHVVGGDGLQPPFAAEFDRILLDAPCSGLGTLGRHPDIRWRVTPPDLERHATRQARLLAALATRVAPGGELVYSTCSLEPEENEGVVLPFLARHREFRRDGGAWRTLPEETGGDGFFAAVLRRSE